MRIQFVQEQNDTNEEKTERDERERQPLSMFDQGDLLGSARWTRWLSDLPGRAGEALERQSSRGTCENPSRCLLDLAERCLSVRRRASSIDVRCHRDCIHSAVD